MRVLHLVSSLDPAAGGVSQAVLTIIKGLAEKGIQNEAATIDAPTASYLQKLSFTVHACGPGKTAWQYAPALLQWLKQHLQQYNAVIVHGLWQYHTYATRKAWQQIEEAKPILFVMPHGMLDPYFQQAKGRKLKAARNQLFWQWNEGKLVNSATALLFTCETEKLLAREPFKPYHPAAEKVIGLGVDAPPPYQNNMKAAFEEKIGAALTSYWLFISRIHPKKGVDLLIQAYLKLQDNRMPVPPLVIAGPGLETPFGKEVQTMASGHNHIFFPGMLTGDAKWGAFYGCDLFVLPSHQENFGIAVVEALACEKPVLISDQVNIWREILQDQAGLVTTVHLESVIAQLHQWLTIPTDQKQLIINNTHTGFKKHFSTEQATRNLLQVLNQ